MYQGNRPYYVCFVPQCINTTIKTPEKKFLSVPKDKKKRKQWWLSARRDFPMNEYACYCCEDHFDLENDVANYLYIKMMGGKAFIKEGVVPHIFECQGRPQPLNKNRMVVARKRKIQEILQDKENIPSTEYSSQPTLSLDEETVGASQFEPPVKHTGFQVLTGNSKSAARSGESSWKNPHTNQDTHRVRKYPSFKEVESDQSSSDEECLRRNTFKATNPETGPPAETSKWEEPEVYIDVAEHPEHSKKPERSKKRRLSTEKDNYVGGNTVSLADWEFIAIKQELEIFEGILSGDDPACDVEVKQELNESMELIKEEHDIVTSDH